MPKPLTIDQFVAQQTQTVPTSSAPAQAAPISIDQFVKAKTSAPAPSTTPSKTPKPLDASRVFSTPLSKIASGRGGEGVDVLKGAIKQGLRDFSTVGAQNAGPVGAAMLAGAPEFAKAIEGFNAFTEPTNEAQKEGARNTLLAELAIPVAPAAKGVQLGADALKTATQASRVEKAGNAVGKILQNPDADINAARSVLSGIERKGIKTYQDLRDRLNEQVGVVSRKLDEAFETNKTTKTLDNLNHSITVGGQTVKQNYVKDALDQLRQFYTKTNNLPEATKIDQLVEKANAQGLTVKEINDIARLHGKDLSGFNASGELASGLSKQAAENTRAGVKATVRDLFGNNLAKAADSQLSKLINVRDDVENMAREVEKLSNKISERGIGERAGRLIGQVVNLIGLNGPKGFIEYFLGRGTGLKTLNALDLQKQLAANLKLIQKAADPQAAEETVVKALEQFIQNMTGKKPLLLLPEKAGTAPRSSVLYGNTSKGLSTDLQEAADAAAAARGVAKPPKPGKAPKPFKPLVPEYDPYAPEATIEFGNGLPKKPTKLPTIR